MNALVVGCGSIGKRHITNLLESERIENIFVYTQFDQCQEYFVGNKRVVITNTLKCKNIDFAILANETYKHIDTALYLADKGINLFIEKPLSHNLRKIDLLKKCIVKNAVKVFIAYNLRFLGAIQFINNHLAKKTIGDVYFASFEAGQYLPQWRPNDDYRRSYSASSERGGGVALDLSHEIDIMRFFWQTPSSWKVEKSKVSNLEIDSEDIFEGVYQYPNGFICRIHLDYLQLDKKREFRIVGSEGTIFCDLINKHVRLSTNNNIGHIDLRDDDMFDIPGTYRKELNHFFDVISSDTQCMISFDDGVEVLKMIEDMNV